MHFMREILTLINVNNVNFEDSYIEEDGLILLRLKPDAFKTVGQLSKFFETIFRKSFKTFKNRPIYILLRISDQISFNGFAVMKKEGTPTFAYIKLSWAILEKEKGFIELTNAVDKWLKEKMREILDRHKVAGILKNDYLKCGTYFQYRKQKDIDIFYIIYRYWEKIKNEKDSNITWIDVMEDENSENKCNNHVFISLNSV